jgi:hypothetical protein
MKFTVTQLLYNTRQLYDHQPTERSTDNIRYDTAIHQSPYERQSFTHDTIDNEPTYVNTALHNNKPSANRKTRSNSPTNQHHLHWGSWGQHHLHCHDSCQRTSKTKSSPMTMLPRQPSTRGIVMNYRQPKKRCALI